MIDGGWPILIQNIIQFRKDNSLSFGHRPSIIGHRKEISTNYKYFKGFLRADKI
jgi:hypothetical protein